MPLGKGVRRPGLAQMVSGVRRTSQAGNARDSRVLTRPPRLACGVVMFLKRHPTTPQPKAGAGPDRRPG